MPGAPLKLLLDEPIHAGLVTPLAGDGHDVVRVPFAGTPESLGDEAILRLAVDEGRALITTDSDLIRIYKEWIEAGQGHPGLVFGRQDPILKRFLRSLRYALKDHDSDSLRDQLVFIPGRLG